MPHICHSGVKFFHPHCPRNRAVTLLGHSGSFPNLICHYVTTWTSRSIPAMEKFLPSSTSFSSCGRFGSALNSFTNAWKVKRQFTGQRDKNLLQIGPKTLRLYQNMMVWLWHINLIGVNSSVDWKLQSFFKWGLRNARGILTKHPSSWRLDTIRSQASTAYAYGALEFWGAANGRHG